MSKSSERNTKRLNGPVKTSPNRLKSKNPSRDKIAASPSRSPINSDIPDKLDSIELTRNESQASSFDRPKA